MQDYQPMDPNALGADPTPYLVLTGCLLVVAVWTGLGWRAVRALERRSPAPAREGADTSRRD